MSCCCPHTAPGLRSPRHRQYRRVLGLAQWCIPGVLYALIPKCPLCLMGYAALWTGLGLSFTQASYIRLALIILFFASVAILLATQARRLIVRAFHP